MRAVLLGLLAGCVPDLGDRSAAAHADSCATCHPVAADQLAGSRHARPAASPLFVELRSRAQDELGAGAFCDRCHLPDGLGCITCHAAGGNQQTANGALLADPTGPVRGPFGDTVGPHASVAGDFLTDSALCGTCHDVEGVAGFDEHPFRAWEASPYAGTDRCQDCHMSPEPGLPAPRELGAIAVEGPERARSDHGFVGLQRAPRDLLARGLVLTAVPGGVMLENRAGHGFPDGASFTREVWLESRSRRDGPGPPTAATVRESRSRRDGPGPPTAATVRESRGTGQWTGDTRPLHAELRRAGVPVVDPVEADETVFRGVPAGETRFEPFPPDVDEVCLRYRPVGAGLSAALGLAVEPAVTVSCVSPR
ncbi:MAG: hypothetical protein R3F61_11240 [Myxococcota bacterium]